MAVAVLALLIAPAARAATPIPWTTASPATGPQYTDPTDPHETNSAWYPFKSTGGTVAGDPTDWVGNAPTEFTDELGVSLGMANYGFTDVFYADSAGDLVLRPWDLTTLPGAPVAQGSGSTTVVPAQSGGAGFLGVVEVGGTAPDLFVFYFKGDPTVASNRTTLYWRQDTESWCDQGEHSVAMPSDFLAGSTWDQVPGAGSTWYLRGRVVALDDSFAFVSLNANGSEVDTYVSNLLAPGATGAVDAMTSWKPATASGQQVRDVDAIPFSYQGSTCLAVGSLYGTPTTNYDSHWGTVIKQWTGMNAAVQVCSVGDGGSCAVDTSTSFAVTACPDQGPSDDGSGLKMQSGALDIRLARGGVASGPAGDVLTVLTRTLGTLDRMLISDNTSVTNHYETIQPELIDAFEVVVDHSQPTPTLEGSPPRYSAWQRRGLMSDGFDDLEEAKTVYQLVDATGLVQRGFFVTTIAVSDPDGPSVPSSVTTASPVPSGSPTPTPTPVVVYGSEKQRLVWATATSLDAHGVNVKNLDDLNDYVGVVGAAGSLDSDELQPVKEDTTDQNGDPLSPAITYPYPIQADTSDLQLIGIVYGTPPISLNNNAQSALFPSLNGTANNTSSVQFGQSTTAGTTTRDTTEGGAGVALGTEGDGGHGLKFPFEPELSWTTDRTDISQNALDVAIGHDWWPGPTDTPTGYAIFKWISDFELQRYTRLDWDGGAIGNGVAESVFVTNPLPTSTNGNHVSTFTLTDPDATDATFTGMKARPDTFDWGSWYTVDPTSDAQGHGELLGDNTKALLSFDEGGGYAWATFTQSSTTQTDVVSNGVSAKLRMPFFTGDYSYTHQVDDTTSTTTTTEVTLGLPQPPAGQPTVLTFIDVTAYWLKADDTDAYWIPDACRTGGNYETPWCIDYQVTDYGTPPSGAEPRCSVAVRCSPVGGGTAHVLDEQRTAGGRMLGTAGSAGQLVKASPAPGFRFAGWKLYGRKVARLDDAGSRQTRVSATGFGGVTVEARFKRIVPRDVTLVRHGRDGWSIAVDRAALGQRPSTLQPWLDGAAPAGARPLKLHIGTDAYRVPATAWRQQQLRGHSVYSKTWRPRGWSRHARVRLTVDPSRRRWSLDVTRGRMTQAMLAAAGGGLPVCLTSSATRQPDIPVACTATFRATVVRPAGIKTAAGAMSAAVDLRNATITTAVDSRHPGKARFALSGVLVRRGLLRRSGLDLAINRTAFHLGPFKKDAGAYVASGRLPDGLRTVCRYTAGGRLSLTLTGGDLADRLRDEFMVQNVRLSVGAGRDAPSGTMAPVATRIRRIRPVPATGELAR